MRMMETLTDEVFYFEAPEPYEPLDNLWLDKPGAMRPKTTKAARKRARSMQKLARRKNRGK